MTLLERFLKYVVVETSSREDKNTTPSTLTQFNLAKILKQELEELGLEKVSITDECIVLGSLKANYDTKETVGLIAHLDTVNYSSNPTKPVVIKNYDGEKIIFEDKVIDPEKFAFLDSLKGKTIITSETDSILGGDDKAGIAIIMGTLNYFFEHQEIKHKNIKIAFTPDEEIGGGIEKFDIKEFGCDYAYTIDGGAFNEINYENFNAASIDVSIRGLDIHPGSSYHKMVNAILVSQEFDSLLPQTEIPSLTQNYEGFHHLEFVSGLVANATMKYIIRNHDEKILERQIKDFFEAKDRINHKYGYEVVSLKLTMGYKNMAPLIKKDFRSIEAVSKAMESLGITPSYVPIRGGTDGANLSVRGLLTPNLGTGNYNCHGPYELACLEEMEMVSKILIETLK